MCFFGGNLPEVARRIDCLKSPKNRYPPTSWEATDLLSRFPGDRLAVFASNPPGAGSVGRASDKLTQESKCKIGVVRLTTALFSPSACYQPFLRRLPIRHPCKASLAPCSSMMVHGADINAAAPLQRGYGATAARLTPDQKVGSSNLSALTFHCPCCHVQGLLTFLAWGALEDEWRALILALLPACAPPA